VRGQCTGRPRTTFDDIQWPGRLPEVMPLLLGGDQLIDGAPRTAKPAIERAMLQTCPNVNSSLLNTAASGSGPCPQLALPGVPCAADRPARCPQRLRHSLNAPCLYETVIMRITIVHDKPVDLEFITATLAPAGHAHLSGTGETRPSSAKRLLYSAHLQLRLPARED
jgi:hypothetical protein